MGLPLGAASGRDRHLGVHELALEPIEVGPLARGGIALLRELALEHAAGSLGRRPTSSA